MLRVRTSCHHLGALGSFVLRLLIVEYFLLYVRAIVNYANTLSVDAESVTKFRCVQLDSFYYYYKMCRIQRECTVHSW